MKRADGIVDGNNRETKKEKGINGGLSNRGKEGMPMNTILVPSVDKFTKKIQGKGGKILMPKMPVPLLFKHLLTASL